MNTPEEIARKWADKLLTEECIPLPQEIAQTIIQAAAEMVRESGAVEALEWADREYITITPSRVSAAADCLREITKHGEAKP